MIANGLAYGKSRKKLKMRSIESAFEAGRAYEFVRGEILADRLKNRTVEMMVCWFNQIKPIYDLGLVSDWLVINELGRLIKEREHGPS